MQICYEYLCEHSIKKKFSLNFKHILKNGIYKIVILELLGLVTYNIIPNIAS